MEFPRRNVGKYKCKLLCKEKIHDSVDTLALTLWLYEETLQRACIRIWKKETHTESRKTETEKILKEK